MLASRLPLATGPGLTLALATFWLLWITIKMPLDVGERFTARDLDYTPRMVDSDVTERTPPERVKPVREPPPAVGPVTPIDSPPVRPTRADPPARRGAGTIGLPNPGGPTIAGGGIDHGPEVLFRGKPDYPLSALRRGIEGRVIVQFTVLASGQVTDVVVVDADPPGVFDAEAIEGVRRWRYRPAVTDGRPVASAGLEAAILFELPRD